MGKHRSRSKNGTGSRSRRSNKSSSHHMGPHGETAVDMPVASLDDLLEDDNVGVLEELAKLTPQQKLEFLAQEFFRIKQENENLLSKVEDNEQRISEFVATVTEGGGGKEGVRALLEQLEEDNRQLHKRNQELLDTVTMMNARSIMCVKCLGKLDPKKLAFRLLSGNGGLVPAFDAMPTAGALPVGQGEPFDRQVRLLVQEELDARSSKKHSHHNRTVAELGLSPRVDFNNNSSGKARKSGTSSLATTATTASDTDAAGGSEKPSVKFEMDIISGSEGKRAAAAAPKSKATAVAENVVAAEKATGAATEKKKRKSKKK